MTDMTNSTLAVRRHGTNLPKEQFDMNVHRKAPHFDAYLQPFMFITSILTLLITIFVWYKAGIFTIITTLDSRIRPIPFFIVIISLLISLTVYGYVTISVLRRKQNKLATYRINLNKDYPKAIYLMTLTGTIAFLLSIFALWPIWTWRTVPLVVLHVFCLVMAPNLFIYIL